MNIIDESKEFEFSHNGEKYTAYVRYYDDGDCDVEMDSDNPEAHDRAWEIADSMGLFDPMTKKEILHSAREIADSMRCEKVEAKP